MNFDVFLDKIGTIQNFELQPQISHSKMEPSERVAFMKNINPKDLQPKNAAVMVLIYPKNGISTLVLILRTSYNGVHSSQVAFPGGKAEQFDANFWHTALRETEEEIGVKSAEIKHIKDLTPLYVPPSNFMVYPFLGYTENEIIFSTDPREVEGIIEIKLNDFLNHIKVISKNLTTSYMVDATVNGFEIDNHFVWGATAMMLSELKDLLKNVA